MAAHRSSCPVCAVEFRADPSQEPAYRASLSSGDRAESERLLRVINAYWALRHHMETEHPEAMFVCGRQAESLKGSGKPEAFWESDHTCSFCGSLSPDKFFEAVEAGCQVGPTDKSYKAYIDLPHPDPEGLRVVGSRMATEHPGDGWHEATPEFCERYDWQPWAEPRRPGERMYCTLGRNGASIHAKFYFQHLDDAGRQRFVQLYNERKMNLGYPGHFYTRPFFCVPVETPAA